MKITIEIEVEHLDREFSVGDAITLDELTAAAGSDLDAVVTALDLMSPWDKAHAVKWVRKQSGGHTTDAKKALDACAWDTDKALDYLRRQDGASTQ